MDNKKAAFSFIQNEIVRGKLVASFDRIVRSYNELFSGYDLDPKDVLIEVVRVKEYTGMVVVSDINFYSFCEHHFAPFWGKAEVRYVPGEKITGLGKIVRLVRDVHARRLQIQETMTKDIAEDMMKHLGAKGVFVRTEAQHLCVCSRGPSDDTSKTITCYGTGVLKDHPRTYSDGNIDEQ